MRRTCLNVLTNNGLSTAFGGYDGKGMALSESSSGKDFSFRALKWRRLEAMGQLEWKIQ
jgi:hypothetical protein